MVSKGDDAATLELHKAQPLNGRLGWQLLCPRSPGRVGLRLLFPVLVRTGPGIGPVGNIRICGLPII